MRGHGKATALAILLFPAMGLAVMALWNAVVPDLFGLSPIGFFRALGLLLLCRLLFGGAGHWFPRPRRPGLTERWHGLSPEEKEAFRQGRHLSAGRGHPWREERNGREERHHSGGPGKQDAGN